MEKLNTLIQDEAALNLLVQKARQTDAVALDTEFVWERTYYPQLGLIQIALSNEECYLIDPIAIKDLSSLGKLLSDRSVIKILHDAPQDLTILQRATGAVPHALQHHRGRRVGCGGECRNLRRRRRKGATALGCDQPPKQRQHSRSGRVYQNIPTQQPPRHGPVQHPNTINTGTAIHPSPAETRPLRARLRYIVHRRI